MVLWMDASNLRSSPNFWHYARLCPLDAGTDRHRPELDHRSARGTLGRGIDFQITVPDTVPLAAALIRSQGSRGYRAVSPYFREHLESRPVFVRLVGPGIAWAVCVQSYSTGVEDAPPANVRAPRSSVRSHSLLALAALDLFQDP
jgi:hypothetical protein